VHELQEGRVIVNDRDARPLLGHGTILSIGSAEAAPQPKPGAAIRTPCPFGLRSGG
jgi:hypothetical protein